jgi:hypothetical protein
MQIQTKQSQAKATLSTNKHGLYVITDEPRNIFNISTANVFPWSNSGNWWNL